MWRGSREYMRKKRGFSYQVLAFCLIPLDVCVVGGGRAGWTI